jgi:predicted metalloprotease with PDZ domain
MEHPDRHLYHVVLTAAGLKGPVIDLRMPAWMPGYYQLLDYAKNLSGLRAVDERGQALPWEKTGRDAWIPFRAKPIATTLPILISCMIVLS